MSDPFNDSLDDLPRTRLEFLASGQSPRSHAVITNVTEHETIVRPSFPWSRSPWRRLLQWLRGDDIGWLEEGWDLHRAFGRKYAAVKELRRLHQRELERAFFFGEEPRG